MMDNRKPGLLFRVGFLAIMVMVVLWMILPLGWAVSCSLKTQNELVQSPLPMLPTVPQWANYGHLLTEAGFLHNLWNSLLVAGTTTLVSLLVGTLAAFALGRFEFAGRRPLLYGILAVSMFPQIALLSGMFLLIKGLGLFNHWLGLAFTHLLFTLPFTTWVLVSFIRTIPRELEEAAAVDGAPPLTVLRLILVPLLAPGLVTAGLLAFIQSWNEFLFALTFTIDDRSRTAPVAIALFSGASQHEMPWAQIMAATVVVTLPLLVLVLLFQDRLVAGLTAGAVKD